jgi:hypothetical protein
MIGIIAFMAEARYISPIPPHISLYLPISPFMAEARVPGSG